jgi:hypothetical protein
MLDLANIIRIGSMEWDIYLGAHRAAGGKIDAHTRRCAYCWARAATALMYLAWLAEHKPDGSLMIIQIEEATNRLERSSEAVFPVDLATIANRFCERHA